MHATKDITLLSSDIVTRRKPIGFSPPDEPLSPLFVRIPAGLAERLDQAASDAPPEAGARRRGARGRGLGARPAELPAERAPPEVLTAEQLAALLQLDVETVRSLAARGEDSGPERSADTGASRQAVLDWLASATPASE